MIPGSLNTMMMGGAIPSDYDLFYTMDDVSGSTVYDETGTYDGTITGTVDFVAGRIGDAAEFDGTNAEYISTGYKTNGGDYTISCWVNFDDFDEHMAIYAEANAVASSFGTLFWLISSFPGVVQFGHFKSVSGDYDAVAAATITLSANTDYHICAVRKNNSYHKIYINGVEDATGSCADVTTTSTFTGTIGDNPDYTGSGTRRVDGWVDQFRIYNYALSQSEINALYNEG